MNNEAPVEVSFGNIEAFDDFDERMAAVDCLFINTVGVNQNTVEWCPNNEPPESDEKLAWLWLIKPSLGESILPQCSMELSKLIKAYNSNTMDSWFEYIST